MAITAQHQKLGEVVARALRDAVFKEQLLNDPGLTLRSLGVEVPEGIEVRFVENTSDVIHLTLPFVASPRPVAIDTFAGGGADLRSAAGRNTPKDTGCCGGGSSIGAVWLEAIGESEPSEVAA